MNLSLNQSRRPGAVPATHRLVRLLGGAAIGLLIALRPISVAAGAETVGPDAPGVSEAESAATVADPGALTPTPPSPGPRDPAPTEPPEVPPTPSPTPSTPPVEPSIPSASPTPTPPEPTATPVETPAPTETPAETPVPSEAPSPPPASSDPSLPTVGPAPTDPAAPDQPLPTGEPAPTAEPAPSAETLPTPPPLPSDPAAASDSALLETVDPEPDPGVSASPIPAPSSGPPYAALAAGTARQTSAAPAVQPVVVPAVAAPVAAPAPAPQPAALVAPPADSPVATDEVNTVRHRPFSLIAASPAGDLPSKIAIAAVPAVAPAVASTAVQVAVDFGKSGSGWAGAVVFNIWLRRQLRERRMSQRQLAMLSGVDHSTISRLLRGDRAPTLETATKLAHALRKLSVPEEAPVYFDRLTEATIFPTQRVEAALRGDEELEDIDVRNLMHAYLALRARRRQARKLNGAPVQEVGRLGP